MSTSRPPIDDFSGDADLATFADQFDREVRASLPTGPREGGWKKVIGHVLTEEDGSDTVLPTPVSNRTRRLTDQTAPVKRPFRYRERTFSMSTRFISTAATFVLVSLLGLGSLFVAVNQPDHGRYAARSPVASPVANTCNVEPLTVDEVIAIVENPYSVIPADFWGTPVPGEETGAVQSQRLLELPYEPAWWMDDSRLLTSGYPTEEDFASATAVADQYLACMANGTFGQIWRLITPEQLQRTILSQFPVYSDEAGVRAYVEENISQSMPRDLAITIFRGDHTYVPNPERNLSRIVYRDSGQPMSGVDYDAALLIGWQVYDTEGNLVAVNDWAGTTIEGDDGLANGTSLTLLRSVSTGQWYVYGLFGMRG